MPDLLADPPPALYLLLAVAAAVAAWLAYRAQTRRSLIVFAAAAGLLALLFLIDRTGESPREEAVRRVNAMAEAASVPDPGRFIEQLSKSFEYRGADRERVRTFHAWDLVRQHNVRVAVWGFERSDTEYPAADQVEIGFYAKAQTRSNDGALIRYIKARFVRDPDGAYRLRTMRFYTPGVSLQNEDPVPGVPVTTPPPVEIADTFAEAFPMTAARVVVTAATAGWATTAGLAATGYAASVIGCDAEAGVERDLSPEETPDGRPGVSLLFFAFSRDALQKALVNRVGQCVLTCAATACYNGLAGDPGKTVRVGGNLRFFGDGWQISKLLGGRRFWRLPTMDGEFLCEDVFGTVKGVAGGNVIILGDTQAETLAAAEAAAAACRAVPGVVLPFPGGVVRSGSKVGSKYKALRASTNQAYCPTLRGAVPSELPGGANAAYEIVIDGLNLAAVEDAMRAALVAAAGCPGVRRVTAGNYGGKLGPFHIHLRQLAGGG